MSQLRNAVFVSHANPEDDAVATWLALRLAREGYRVWCDKTTLLAGEKFWNDIEDAIRQHTVKLIYVLSRVSNSKPGPRKELHLALNVGRAEQLKDFVLPVLVDDLPAREFNIHLAELNVLSFAQSWALGLAKLLEKFERDGVPKDSRYSPEALATWWRTRFSAQAGVTNIQSQLLSNWFRVVAVPAELFVHHVGDAHPNLTALPEAAVQQGPVIVSFEQRLNLGVNTRTVRTEDFLSSGIQKIADSAQAHRMFVRLIASAWERLMASKGLVLFPLSRRRYAGVFLKDLVVGDRLPVCLPGSRTTHRGIVGYKTVGPPDKRRKRYWHYAVSATFTQRPIRALCIRPHVLFSDDGKNLWEKDARIQRARRSQCKQWWNPDWRDRLIATMTWFGNGDAILLPVAQGRVIEVENTPQRFESPVSYDHRKLAEDELDDSGDEDSDDNDIAEPTEPDDGDGDD